MRKLKKQFGKLNSVEAYDCICWTSLASCNCTCGCNCNPVGISMSSHTKERNAISTNESVYHQYQSNNYSS